MMLRILKTLAVIATLGAAAPPAHCGDDLTRDNLVKRANSFKDIKLDLVLAGITLKSTAEDRNPVKQLQMARFDGKSWINFDDTIAINKK